jgi:adenylate cyclase
VFAADGADEEGTHESQSAAARVPRSEVTKHHGRIVKTTGDGMLVEFARPMPCAAASKGITEL